MAVETGLWPLKEAIYGKVTHTYVPKRKPVEDYLKLQGRFRHLLSRRDKTKPFDTFRNRSIHIGNGSTDNVHSRMVVIHGDQSVVV